MTSALLSNRRRVEASSEPSVNTGGPRSINDIPDEMMLKIFSYIGPEDLCFVGKVCERWNNLAKDVTLWKKLSYSCDRTSDLDGVVQVLTVAPALHSLNIRRREDAVLILDVLFDSHVDLRKLIVNYSNLSEVGTDILTNVVTLYPDLEVLSLEGCSLITPADYGLISKLKKLSDLNLSYCQGLSVKTVCHIVDSCQHLKKLNVDGMYTISNEDAVRIIEKLGKQLTTLVLSGNSLTDVAYLILNNCPRLQELGVSYCVNMTDRGLLEGIGSLQELTSLRLSINSKLTAQTLSTFLHRPSMTSIVLLDLSFCRSLDDEGLNGIAKRCAHLKELDVSLCSIVTDEGISMVVRNCSQLRVLNLKGLKRITGKVWLELMATHLPHLRLFSLDKCYRVCDEYIEELLVSAPMLIVISRSGKLLGAVSDELRETIYGLSIESAYHIIRQWALGR